MSIAEIQAKLPELLSETGHSEIWSIPLDKESPQRDLVLSKYLKAHNGDSAAATEGIRATLAWRKEFDPVSQVTAVHDASRFGGLGYLSELDPASVPSQEVIRPGGGGRKAVITWNVYGAVTDHNRTFGNIDDFLKWRVGLMEQGVNALRLMDPSLDPPSDDIAMLQVHDYLNVSFLRPNPATRAATKKTIEVLAAHYPELLSRKYFVNVPVVMGFMFTLIKPFVAKETVAKFQVMSYATSLAGELGKEVPTAYGGEGADLTVDEDTAQTEVQTEAKDAADKTESAEVEGGKVQA